MLWELWDRNCPLWAIPIHYLKPQRRRLPHWADYFSGTLAASWTAMRSFLQREDGIFNWRLMTMAMRVVRVVGTDLPWLVWAGRPGVTLSESSQLPAKYVALTEFVVDFWRDADGRVLFVGWWAACIWNILLRSSRSCGLSRSLRKCCRCRADCPVLCFASFGTAMLSWRFPSGSAPGKRGEP